MSQSLLEEELDQEQFLSTALAVELGDAKKTLAQFKLEKPKSTHSGPFSFVDYLIEKISKEKGSNKSRLQRLEAGEQPRDKNLYKIIWKLENFPVIFNNVKLFEETKNKNDTDPNLSRDFCRAVFLCKPYGYNFFVRAFPYGCASALGRSMSITICLITGPFDDILS